MRKATLALADIGVAVALDGGLIVPVLRNAQAKSLTAISAEMIDLAARARDKKLMPTDLRERAQLYRWLLFTTTELEQPLWRIARHSNIYPVDKRPPAEIEATDPAARRAYERAARRIARSATRSARGS